MNIDFSAEYARRSDDELLRLASDRQSLTDDAVAALDLELGRRGLTGSDVEKYQLVRKRNEVRQKKRVLRQAFGTRRGRDEWFKDLILILLGAFVISLVSAIHQILPGRYQVAPDRQEAAFIVMAVSTFIVVFGFSWWRRVGFWLSLALSTILHFVVVQRWLVTRGSLGHIKTAVALGVLLFFLLYGCAYLLKKKVLP